MAAGEERTMAGSSDAETILRASVEAYNRHDLDACMALLDPGVTWDVMGMGQSLTHDELRIVLWQYFLREVQTEIRTMTTVGSLVAAEYIQTLTDDDQRRRISAPVACF